MQSPTVLNLRQIRTRLEIQRRRLERRKHSWSLKKWAEWLALNFPEYRKRSIPQIASCPTSRAKRVEVLERRRQRGEELFHPDDSELPADVMADAPLLTADGKPLRNGAGSSRSGVRGDGKLIPGHCGNLRGDLLIFPQSPQRRAN
jgi:hypothetical protein